MTLYAIIFLIEIAVLIYLIQLLYTPCVEYFVLEKKYNDKQEEIFTEPKLKELQDKINPLFADDIVYDGVLKNINKKRILNEISLFKGNKSYTINKEHIYMCLKDENDQYYDDNMLIYVLLHEISHGLSHSIGHTPEFHEKFQALLDKAIAMKIYNPDIPVVKNYCNF